MKILNKLTLSVMITLSILALSGCVTEYYEDTNVPKFAADSKLDTSKTERDYKYNDSTYYYHLNSFSDIKKSYENYLKILKKEGYHDLSMGSPFKYINSEGEEVYSFTTHYGNYNYDNDYPYIIVTFYEKNDYYIIDIDH